MKIVQDLQLKDVTGTRVNTKRSKKTQNKKLHLEKEIMI